MYVASVFFNLLRTEVPSCVFVRWCGCYLCLRRMPLRLFLCRWQLNAVCLCVLVCHEESLWSSAGTLGLQYNKHTQRHKHCSSGVVSVQSCGVLAAGCAFIVSVSDLWAWWLLFLLLKVGLCKCIIIQDYRYFNLPLLWKRQINNSKWMICADR